MEFLGAMVRDRRNAARTFRVVVKSRAHRTGRRVFRDRDISTSRTRLDDLPRNLREWNVPGRVNFNGKIACISVCRRSLSDCRLKSWAVEVQPTIPGIRAVPADLRSPREAGPPVARPRVARPRVARPRVARPRVARPRVARPRVARPRVAARVAGPRAAELRVAGPRVAGLRVAGLRVAVRPRVVRQLAEAPPGALRRAVAPAAAGEGTEAAAPRFRAKAVASRMVRRR